MKKCYCLFWALMVLLQVATAQQRKPAARASTDPDDDDDYTSVTTYGVTTNTNSGILGGFVLRHAKLLPNELFGKRQYRYLAIEVVNVRHPKETSESRNTGARFTPNKQNYLFVIRPQYGREFVLSSRTADEGIAINGIVAVGPSIGIVKPYFVQFQSRPGQSSTQPYTPGGIPSGSILGAGGIFQGLDQATIVPGINLKMAVSFELSAFRSNSTGLEIGFLAEAFSKKVAIMALADNYSFFTSGYITLFFGSKK